MFQQIFPNVFALISGNDSCNCFLVKGRDKIALVDSGTKSNAGALLSGLERIGIGPEKVSFVLHTHGHADYIGCDEFFPNARIAMHRIDAKMVNEKNDEFACTSFFPGTALPKVSILLKDRQKIGLGGISLEVVHTPGHTAGSVCFLLRKEMALFSGDTLFVDGFGRTDLPSGNAKKLVESLKKLQKIGFKGLFPGHGPYLLGREENCVCIKSAIRAASKSLV
ncbi:MAG: MBL fold metallo-hydrolase [archaeon]